MNSLSQSPSACTGAGDPSLRPVCSSCGQRLMAVSTDSVRLALVVGFVEAEEYSAPVHGTSDCTCERLSVPGIRVPRPWDKFGGLARSHPEGRVIRAPVVKPVEIQGIQLVEAEPVEPGHADALARVRRDRPARQWRFLRGRRGRCRRDPTAAGGRASYPECTPPEAAAPMARGSEEVLRSTCTPWRRRGSGSNPGSQIRRRTTQCWQPASC